jgi:hypothetical protein
VLCAEPDAAARDHAQHERDARLAAHHEPELRCLVHDLVEGDAGEVGELQLDHGAQARVNAICPGLIRTPLTEQYFADDAFEEGLHTVVPQGRVGVADDVADAALYLASDQSAYVNGIALTVDGGWLAEKSFAAGEAAGRTFLTANETRDDV